MEKNKQYRELINKHAPSSPVLKDCTLAFLTGGAICAAGELIASLLESFMPTEKAYLTVTVLLICSASVLTTLGVFDKVARFSGGGTLVPVTGFSNSVTSAAIDTRSEGYVAGVGSKIFTVAGPVILYSTAAGTAYGVIYYIYTLVAGGSL